MEKLDVVIDSVKENAHLIISSFEQHLLTVFAIDSGGVSILYPLLDSQDDFKHCMTTILRQLNSYAYVMVSEAWIAKFKTESDILKSIMNGEMQIIDLPPDDRQEVLVITAVERRKYYRSWTANIEYSRENERYLDEWKEIVGKPTGGKMMLEDW